MSGVRGVVPAIVTPFDADGAVDHMSLTRVVAEQRAAGADGLLALGLAGEGIYLSFEERSAVLQTVVDAAGDLPVLAGCTADTTDDACRLVEMASRKGASEIMVAPPRRPDWTVDDLHEHFRRVAGATDREIMVQDAPFAIGVELGVEFVLKLASEFANIRSYKVEALPYWPNATRARSVAGDRLRILGGHGGLYLLDVLESDADGLIPGCDLTAELVDAWEAFAAGERDEADRRYRALLPFLVYEAQSLGMLVGGAKALLERRGVIATTRCRLPEANVSDASLRRLLDIAIRCGVVSDEAGSDQALAGGRGAR